MISNLDQKVRRWSRTMAIAVAGLLLADSVLTPLAQAQQSAHLWEQRRQAATAAASPETYAALPSALGAPLPPPSALRLSASAALSEPSSELTSIVSALPATAGDVRAIVSHGAPRLTVVHVQDIHANDEAQENIRVALASLIDHAPVAVVALEGAFGPVDLSRFRAYPKQGSIRRVADYLLNRHDISGAVRAGLETRSAPRFVGIDDASLHGENRRAYVEAAPGAAAVAAMVERAHRQIAEKKASTFSQSLRRFDDVVEGYRSGSTTITGYARELLRFTDDVSPALRTFVAAADLESHLDFDRVQSERSRVLARLVAQLSSEQLADLLHHGAAYRAGALRHAQFYAYLNQLCARHGVDLKGYPAMDAYIRYVLMADAVDAYRLLEDVAAAETSVYARLAPGAPERALLDQAERLHLISKLLTFSLTNDEWRRYQALAGVSVDGVPPGRLSPFEAFYRAADKRDEAMAERFAAETADQHGGVAVLVTGGFHSHGIEERLSRRGMRIINFVPSVSKMGDAGGSYLSVFARERTPLDRLFEGQKLFLAPDPAHLHQAPVLTAALDPADGPAAIVHQLAPESPEEIALVSAVAGATTLDVTNKANGEEGLLTVRFDEDAIEDVEDAPKGAHAWFAGIRERFQPSPTLRLRWAMVASVPSRIGDAIEEFFHAPRFRQRGLLGAFAGLLMLNAAAPAFPQTNGAPPRDARPAHHQTAPALPPLDGQRLIYTPSKAPPKASPPAAAAAKRRAALRQLRSEMAEARAEDSARVSRTQQAVRQIREKIDRLRRDVDQRERTIRDGQAELARLEKQLSDTKARLTAPSYRTQAPASEIHAAAQALAATDWNALADDVVALRSVTEASGAPGAEKGGALSDRWNRATTTLRTLAHAADDLKALDARVAANPALGAEESAAMAGRLDDLKGTLESAADIPTLIAEAQDAAIALNAVPDSGRAAFAARADGVIAATRQEALDAPTGAVARLSTALVNLESLRAESASLGRQQKNLERQISRLRDQLSSLRENRHMDTAALADQIDRVATDGRTIADLSRDADSLLHSLHPAGGTWGAALATISDGLENLREAQAQLRDPRLTPQEQLSALNVAVRSILEIRRAAPAFNQLTNPEYDDELQRLPKDLDLLTPDARRSYDAFRARLNRESPSNRDLSDAEALALWYGHFLRVDVGTGFPSVSLENMIVGAETLISNRLNLLSRAGDLNRAADREEARRAGDRQEAETLNRAKDNLERLRLEIQKDADRAAKLAPTARVITDDFRLPADRVTRLGAAIKAVDDRPTIRFVGSDGASLDRLLRDVRADMDRLAKGPVSNADAAQARERLTRLVSRLDDFVNPAVVTYGEGDVVALRDMMHETVNAGILWLAGITDARLRAGVTGEDTYEDRLVRAAVAIYGAPEEAYGARRHLEQLKKDSHWGVFDLLEGINVFMGLVNFQQNFDTFMGKKNPFTFKVEYFPHYWEPPIVTEKSLIPATQGPSLLLGSANAMVSANGAVAELRLALTGESPERAVPYFAGTLFPEVFDKSVWEIVDPAQADQEGYVYYRTTGFALRTKVGASREGHMKWQPVAERAQALNRLYRVRGGVVEVMASGRDHLDLEARVNHLVRAAQAINNVISFTNGLRARIVSPTPTALARVNAAMSIIGTISSIEELIDKAKFKQTLRSDYGGWVTSPDPAFSATMTLVYPDGTRVQMGALRANGALLLRRENVWEAPDGTPVYRIGQGRLKVSLNLLRLRLRVWRSAERFQESTREAGKAASLATAHEGVFVRRRPNSAAVRVVDVNGQPHLQTEVGGATVRYWLGVPVPDIPVDGKLVTARPFYSVDADGHPRDMIGVVIGDASLETGNTVSYQTIFTYLGSLPEKMNGLLVQLGVEQWYELNPLEARFANPGIPAYPGAGWVTNLDGTERFVGTNAAGDRTPLFLRWHDSEGTFVLDLEKRVLYRFGTDATGHSILTGVIGISLPALANTKERPAAENQWEPDRSNRRPRPADTLLRGLGDNVQGWIDSESGAMFVRVPPMTVVDGVRFTEGGTYRNDLGGAGARRAEEAITHPFYRRDTLPLAPDLSKIFDKSAAVTNVRRRADGSNETWYGVSRLVPDAKSGEPKEVQDVFVEYTEAGRRRVDRVTMSAPGFVYEMSVVGEPRPWETRLVLPKNLTWVPGTVPAAIAPFLPVGDARAEFAQDARGNFYLRITMADGREFTFVAGASPAEMRAEANAIQQGPAQVRAPLPANLPDALVAANGRAGSLIPTVAGAEQRIAQLTDGRVILAEGSIDDVRKDFARRGLELRDEGEPVPFGGVPVVPHLAFEPGNSRPTSVVVVVERDGGFVPPETPTAAPIPVKKGQVLIIEPGLNPTHDRETRLGSPRPFLDRVFLSPAAVGRQSAEPVVERGSGHLPAVLGTGADRIEGRWSARVPLVDGIPETRELYFLVTTGGIVTDPVTGVATRMEPGTLWILQRTPAGANAFVGFNDGGRPGWTVRFGDATPAGGLPFTVPGPNGAVPGRLVLPSAPDHAPLFVAELPIGETRRVSDVVTGDVPVANGDTLVYQWPAGFQRASLDAQGRSENLYLPSNVGRAQIAADYESQPSPDGTPRRLVRGRARPGLLPQFPSNVPLDVWLDPNHSDSPMIVEVAGAPATGAAWAHPQLHADIPLEAGTTFVRVPTVGEMRRDLARTETGARPTLVETPWDRDSTLLNARHQFDRRQDAAAQWRRSRGHLTPWSFETRVGGLRATVIEDIGNPLSAWLNPSLDLIIFHEAGEVDGVRVQPGSIYRRNATLRAAQAQADRVSSRHWGVGYPVASAGSNATPITFDRPVLTSRHYLDPKHPFTSDGRPNLVTEGSSSDAAVQVVRRNGVVYVVEGKAPSASSLAVVFNLATGVGSEIHASGFNTPQFGGLTQVQYLDGTARAKLQARARELTGTEFELTPDMMVRLNAQREPEAVIVLGEPAAAWSTDRQNGLGMVQMDAGVHRANLRGTSGPRSYSGWIGIGNGPGFLTLDQVRSNMIDLEPGVWMLMDENGRRIGLVIFGAKAAEAGRRAPPSFGRIGDNANVPADIVRGGPPAPDARPLVPPAVPVESAAPSTIARPTTRTASRDTGAKRLGFATLLSLISLSTLVGLIRGRRGNDDGAGGGGNRGGPGPRSGGPEDRLAKNLVRSLVLLSELPSDRRPEEDQRARVLDALRQLFEGAPLNQDLASVDGRVESLLSAFEGEGVDGPAFRAAFRREMEAKFGREISLEEALGLAHGVTVQGMNFVPMAQVMPSEFGDGAAAVIVVTESMRANLQALVDAVPVARDGKRVVFVAENEDLRQAVAAAASRRSDSVAIDGSAAFAGAASDRTRRLRLDGIERVLATALAPDFFQSISSLTLISPEGLPIDTEFSGSESGVIRDLLRQAVVVLINEQLQAAALSVGTLQSIGALARVISSQA